jgi:predicted N-acetyltransferase YhbS
VALRLAEETEDDLWEVEALYDLCFAPGREALSSYRLVTVGGRGVLLLGPVAVHPTRQGEGLGALLMTESLAEAVRQGWRRVMLVGDAPYYRRFGFAKLHGVVMPPPTNPDRVLGRSLGAEAWAGVQGMVTKWDTRQPVRPE